MGENAEILSKKMKMVDSPYSGWKITDQDVAGYRDANRRGLEFQIGLVRVASKENASPLNKNVSIYQKPGEAGDFVIVSVAANNPNDMRVFDITNEQAGDIGADDDPLKLIEKVIEMADDSGMLRKDGSYGSFGMVSEFAEAASVANGKLQVLSATESINNHQAEAKFKGDTNNTSTHSADPKTAALSRAFASAYSAGAPVSPDHPDNKNGSDPAAPGAGKKPTAPVKATLKDRIWRGVKDFAQDVWNTRNGRKVDLGSGVVAGQQNINAANARAEVNFYKQTVSYEDRVKLNEQKHGHRLKEMSAAHRNKMDHLAATFGFKNAQDWERSGQQSYDKAYNQTTGREQGKYDFYTAKEKAYKESAASDTTAHPDASFNQKKTSSSAAVPPTTQKKSSSQLVPTLTGPHRAQKQLPSSSYVPVDQVGGLTTGLQIPHPTGGQIIKTYSGAPIGTNVSAKNMQTQSKAQVVPKQKLISGVTQTSKVKQVKQAPKQ